WKRRIVLAIVTPILCVAAYYVGAIAANGFSSRENRPQAVVVDGLSVEANSLSLGEVWETPNHTVSLMITNVSSETRKIKQFATSCDCTAIEPSTLIIDPGSSKEIKVHLNLTHRQPYQLGMERWPISVQIRPVFDQSFVSNDGWKVAGVVLSRVSL